MPYQLSEINEKIRRDPAAFLAECDAHYQERIHAAVDKILARMKESPIVLLSGPSGSGKTTTAMKVERELERRGGQRPHGVHGQLLQDPQPQDRPPHAGGGHRLRVPETAGHGAAGRDL